MSFQVLDALRVLGLTWDQRLNTSAIEQAWKQMIFRIHPDKNRGQQATEQTQKLNSARDTLLYRLVDPEEKKRRESEEEALAREREKVALEARHREQMEREQREYQEFTDRVKKIKRERYTRNRRKRLPGTRAHRTSAESAEGNALILEMERFFRECFEMCQGNRLKTSEISALFVASRPMTDLESNLFKRHSKKLFKAAWPKAVYSMYQNQRCFLDVKKK